MGNNLVNLVNRVNFLGLIPKCGVDQSDCKITFLSWPLSLKLFFWSEHGAVVLNVARLHKAPNH